VLLAHGISTCEAVAVIVVKRDGGAGVVVVAEYQECGVYRRKGTGGCRESGSAGIRVGQLSLAWGTRTDAGMQDAGGVEEQKLRPFLV
jgi:hypothetical protein